MKKLLLLVLIMSFLFVGCSEDENNDSVDDPSNTEDIEDVVDDDINPNPEEDVDLKPVIYLYPQEETDVSVRLHYKGELLYTYPAYEDGWDVTAYPDGTIICDEREYSYLFWEGISDVEYDMSEGFVVKGEDTEEFLVDKLQYLGLSPKEYNEFIVFWLPRMINNEYNLITFQQEVYTENAVLDILPQPDSMLRVFMAYKPLDEAIEIESQTLYPFERTGFAVIEWGGTEIQ